MVSAVLKSFDGRNGVTRTANGPGTIFVDEGAPIRLLVAENLRRSSRVTALPSISVPTERRTWHRVSLCSSLGRDSGKVGPAIPCVGPRRRSSE
jgi:hypothetical protein